MYAPLSDAVHLSFLGSDKPQTVTRQTPCHQSETKPSPPSPLAMPRRKPRPATDGWTTIPGKGRPPLRNPSTKPGHLPEPPAAPTNYTKWLATTTNTLHTLAHEIRHSPLWTTLNPIFTNTPLTNVVILGLGSLTSATKESSFYQLSLITEIRTLLPPDHRCYLQDPAFTPTDVRFFAEDRGDTVLQHPEAEAYIGAGTLLYAPHLEYEVLKAALGRRPAVVFCNDLQGFLDMRVGRGDEYGVFREYLRDWECLVLKGVDGHDQIGGGRAFNHSAIYWQKRELVGSDFESAKGVEGLECGLEERDSGPLVGKPEGEAEGLDEGVQDIISNIKDYTICIGSSQHIDQGHRGHRSLLRGPSRIDNQGMDFHQFSER